MADNAALLSPADVQIIRRYVQSKYAPLPGSQQADIVATAIRETLQRRLPELPADIKTRLANELIRRCLLAEQREIKADDVLNVCAEIELSDPSQEYLILDPVLRWMNERAPGVWNPERLITRLFKRQPETFAVGETAATAEFTEAPDVPAELSISIPGAGIWARIPRPAWVLAVLVLAGGVVTGLQLGKQPIIAETPISSPPPRTYAAPVPAADIGMPKDLQYRDIDAGAVKSFLESRDSMLADEPYFSAIVNGARSHDINPLILFAITGQEQGFVPKSNKKAKEIANNPFNVFHSWEDYNTDIADSADIAARTISRRGNKRPEGHEPFVWLNLTYAEDPNWASGVKKIFDKLSSLPSVPAKP